jgi:hypothetical protein
MQDIYNTGTVTALLLQAEQWMMMMMMKQNSQFRSITLDKTGTYVDNAPRRP